MKVWKCNSAAYFDALSIDFHAVQVIWNQKGKPSVQTVDSAVKDYLSKVMQRLGTENNICD